MRGVSKTKSIKRSHFEDEVASLLNLLKVKFEYEKVSLKYTKPSTNHKYTPDFILPNGIICEAKGWLHLSDRKKMLLVIAQHPDLDIRFIFQNPNAKLSAKSKTTYAKWCDKNKIKWGTIADLQAWASE